MEILDMYSIADHVQEMAFPIRPGFPVHVF